MEDPRSRCAIFCVADVPPSTIERFLEATKNHHLGELHSFTSEPMNTAHWFALISTKDVSPVKRGLASPVPHFASPFIGESIDEVAAWFRDNISDPKVSGYMHTVFIVLEQEAIEDDICTIVTTVDVCIVDQARQQGRLRSDFTLALQNVCVIGADLTMEEGIMGSFKRSGTAMTKDNYKIAMDRGLYLDGMEVKVDEDWRDFANW